MDRAVKQHATYQDVLDAPENMIAEILHGELFLQSRPTLAQGEARAVLGMVIGAPFRLGRGGPGGWVIQYEPELHFGDDVLVPDLAGWRRAAHPDLDLTAAFATTPPDWICEVLSPSTQRKDRIRKLPIYGAVGVGHAWLVDPTAQTLEVFALRDGAWTLIGSHEGAARVRAAPFDAVELDLGELWVPAND